jgi:hypothetical protein
MREKRMFIEVSKFEGYHTTYAAIEAGYKVLEKTY